jgi:hypothetical protein
MEIFKLKTELDSSQVTNTTLKETITIKENDIRLLHERVLDVRFNQDRFLLSFLFSMKRK